MLKVGRCHYMMESKKSKHTGNKKRGHYREGGLTLVQARKKAKRHEGRVFKVCKLANGKLKQKLILSYA
jgi:hypothetical protein